MDLRWIDDVLVLLEERNMTRAAERRNITQPAFSRRIRSFEDWLGAPILDRRSNSVGISSALSENEAELRALASRLVELRTKIVHFKPSNTTVAIAAQHAPVHSMFPDMALRAQTAFPGLNFRLRAGNLNDCVTLFLRGDTSMLLCYEAVDTEPLAFGPSIRRALWGKDFLVPVVGGALRYAVNTSGHVPENTPAIVYPDTSYFGAVLARAGRAFGTAAFSSNPFCQTAFSSGVHEMVWKGLGLGWLPFSMVYRQLESGDMLSLANSLGKVELDVAVYADDKSDMAQRLLAFWSR
jgi:DNA-binding transcriptional LysR family regulator